MADRTSYSELFPLSLSQVNIFHLEQLHGGTSINNICSTIRIRGRFDISLIQRCLNRVLEEDSALRIRIVLTGDTPMQYHAAYRPEQFQFYDFTLTDADGITRWETAAAQTAIPFFDSPLYYFAIFKDSEKSGGIFIKLHHIVSDGWALVQLTNRIAQKYLALLSDEEPGASTLPEYKLHVLKEQEYCSSKTYQKDMEYWKECVEKFCGDRARLKSYSGASISPVGKRMSFPLSETLNHAITDFCVKHRVAPFSVFYMALAIYLGRIGGSHRVSIGVPILNRSTYSDKNTGGMFVSTLPFFGEVDENMTFEAFSDDTLERWYDLLRHQHFPFPDITAMAKEVHPDTARLFDVVLSFQDSRIFQSAEASMLFSGKWIYSGYQAEHLLIHLTSLVGENCYSVDYDYLTQIFSTEDIINLHNYITKILAEALQRPGIPIWQIPVLSDGEKESVLFSFNRTKTHLPYETVPEAMCAVASQYPDRAALIHDGKRFTYRTLIKNAQDRARFIASILPGQENIIALYLDRSFELVTSMLAASFSGNAWVILPPDLPAGRLNELLHDSGASLLITSTQYEDLLETSNLSVLNVDIPVNIPAQTQPAQSEPSSLAYMVYTSGSTGKPKGVLIEQRSLVNFAQAMNSLYSYGGVLSFCNIGFDVFVLESIASLINGRTVVLADKKEQDNPAKLASLIRGYSVGFFATTPSRLKTCLKNKAFLNALSGVQSIVLGGEHLTGELIQQLKLHTDARIYNQYGPSEATIGVSYKLVNDASVISAGKPMNNCRLYVLDEHKMPLPIGAYGELYIGGVCVGRGYHGDSELTNKKFFPSPFEQDELIYQTGDLACWDKSGEILLGERRDDQIKLRGLRIELGEIKSRIESYPRIDQAAVRVIQQGEGSFITAYYAAQSPIDEVDLLRFLSSQLPSYMLPASLMHLSEIPITLNGKVNSALLPEPQLENGRMEPVNQVEETVLAVFRNVLKRQDLNMDSDYFLLGGDSLNAIDALARLSEQLGAELRISDLYACRTACRLAAHISGTPVVKRSGASKIQRVRQDFYPLTATQQSMYFATEMDRQGLSYNMPGCFALQAPPDIGRLEQAFQSLIASEPILRTSFSIAESGVVQTVQDVAPFELERLNGSFEEASRAFLRPFDLARAPLLRAALWQGRNQEVRLFVDVHHIISDGVSTPLLLERLNRLYCGENPVAQDVSFLDYACYWAQDTQGREAAKDYWKHQLAGLDEPLTLPTDQPRPKEFDYKGASLSFDLGRDVSSAIDEYAKKQGVTPFALMAAAYGILLRHTTRRSDFVVGMPIAGRNLPETQDMIGPLINTLPLRLNLAAGDYVASVSRAVNGALDYGNISMEEILSLADAQHSPGASLYSVLFTMRPAATDAPIYLGEQELTYVPLNNVAAKMDLVLDAYRRQESYHFNLDYASSLFTQDTIAFYGRSYLQILKSLAAGTPITEIDPLSPQDRYALIERPQHLRAPYMDQCIDQMTDHFARVMPDAPALRFHGKTMTYGEFAACTDSIAVQLREQGVSPHSCVGVCCRRTMDMATFVFGVMKAGCSYVPLTTDIPPERFRKMLEISGAFAILSDATTATELDFASCKVIVPDLNPRPFIQDFARNSEDLAQILFTSGSTGEPKGVMIPHRPIANLLGTLRGMYEKAGATCLLCASSILFDSFTTDILTPLAAGLCVAIADEQEMMDPRMLADIICQTDADLIFSTPSRMKVYLTEPAFFDAMKQIRMVMSGGEVMNEQLVKSLRQATDADIYNLYGPTETIAFVTRCLVCCDHRPNIGRPIPNTFAYVLDESLRPAFPTAAGELYVAGECLSNGYINRPDLTQKVFVANPFCPAQRMYRTGDMARLLPDGSIDYIGRRDSQVKMNGQRIELDEITGCIMQTGLVKNAAVIAQKDAQTGTRLVAFVMKKGELAADIDGIQRMLKDKLPPYMVPSSIQEIPQMPETATGKTDLRALSEYVSEPNSVPSLSAASEPAIDVRMEEVWREVLRLPVIERGRSFFDQGGTSLAALSTIIQYFKLGIQITLSEFYETPTIDGQLKFVQKACVPEMESNGKDEHSCESQCAPRLRIVQNEGAQESEKAEPRIREVSAADRLEIIQEEASPEKIAPNFGESDTACQLKFLQEEVVPELEKTQTDKTCFLTGATGFLGAHILYELLETRDGYVYCLVRDGKKRLNDTLGYYFGKDFLHRHAHRYQAVMGDIGDVMLGMDPDTYEKCAAETDIVIHCAADVRHYVNEAEAMRANVTGTKNMIGFAKNAGAGLMHVSTLSVSGDRLSSDGKTNYSLAPVEFDENCFDIGQNWRDNIYTRTKFMAEQEILEAAKEGLNAKIFRVGRLVGRSSDGKFQKNPDSNYFYLLVRGALQLNCLPEALAEVPIELSAVDLCARAIVELFRAEGTVFHIYNAFYTDLKTIFDAMKQPLELVNAGEFSNRLFQAISGNMNTESIAVLTEVYNGTRVKHTVIEPVARKTQQALYELGFQWPQPDPAVLLQAFSEQISDEKGGKLRIG